MQADTEKYMDIILYTFHLFSQVKKPTDHYARCQRHCNSDGIVVFMVHVITCFGSVWKSEREEM